MYVIGLTGSIACGKSTVAQMLRDLGATVIDADAISRRLTDEGGAALGAIRAQFGDRVFSGDTLERKALGQIIFADTQKRRMLEAILHPLIIEEIKSSLRTCRARREKIVVLDVPLLFECGLNDLCNEVFCVWLDEDDQIARLMARDQLSKGEAIARIRSQMPLEQKLERSQVHIDTGVTLAQTRARVESVYCQILQEEEG